MNFFNAKLLCVGNEKVPKCESGGSVGIAQIHSSSGGVNAEEFWVVRVCGRLEIVHPAIGVDAQIGESPTLRSKTKKLLCAFSGSAVVSVSVSGVLTRHGRKPCPLD